MGVSESRPRQKELVGTSTTGRAGLGYCAKTQVGKAQGKDKHHLIQEEVPAAKEDERVSKTVGLRQQAADDEWEEYSTA